MWQTLIVKPLGWLLLTLYNFTANYGLALLLFTLVIKIVFLPITMKGKKSMHAMQRFTPKMKELEAKYKNDKEKYNVELQKLYKKEKVNPLGGCLWQLLPWPVFIALYGVVRSPLENMMGLVREQIELIANVPVISTFLSERGIDLAQAFNNQIIMADGLHAHFAEVSSALPQLADSLVNIDFSFLGMNLSETPVFSVLNLYWILPILSGGLTFLSTMIAQKLSGQPAAQEQNSTMKAMTYVGPVMSIYIGYMWPAALSVYWIANSAFSMIIDVLLNIYYKKKFDVKDAETKRLEAIEQEKLERKKELQALKKDDGAKPGAGNISNKKYKQLKSLQMSQKARQRAEAYIEGKNPPAETRDEEAEPDGADANSEE